MPVLENVERRCARAVLSVMPRSPAASCRLRPLARHSASCASLCVSSKSLRMVSTGGRRLCAFLDADEYRHRRTQTLLLGFDRAGRRPDHDAVVAGAGGAPRPQHLDDAGLGRAAHGDGAVDGIAQALRIRRMRQRQGVVGEHDAVLAMQDVACQRIHVDDVSGGIEYHGRQGQMIHRVRVDGTLHLGDIERRVGAHRDVKMRHEVLHEALLGRGEVARVPAARQPQARVQTVAVAHVHAQVVDRIPGNQVLDVEATALELLDSDKLMQRDDLLLRQVHEGIGREIAVRILRQHLIASAPGIQQSRLRHVRRAQQQRGRALHASSQRLEELAPVLRVERPFVHQQRQPFTQVQRKLRDRRWSRGRCEGWDAWRRVGSWGGTGGRRGR